MVIIIMIIILIMTVALNWKLMFWLLKIKVELKRINIFVHLKAAL